MTNLKLITEAEFNREVEQHPGGVLVDFFAPWCGPCKIIAPMLETLATEMPSVKIVKVDGDHARDLMVKYGVRSIPTLMLFNKGERVATKVGAAPLSELRQFVGQLS